MSVPCIGSACAFAGYRYSPGRFHGCFHAPDCVDQSNFEPEYLARRARARRARARSSAAKRERPRRRRARARAGTCAGRSGSAGPLKNAGASAETAESRPAFSCLERAPTPTEPCARPAPKPPTCWSHQLSRCVRPCVRSNTWTPWSRKKSGASADTQLLLPMSGFTSEAALVVAAILDRARAAGGRSERCDRTIEQARLQARVQV